MYDKSFQKEGCSSNFGRNGPSEYGMTSFMSDYMFQLNEEELGKCKVHHIYLFLSANGPELTLHL